VLSGLLARDQSKRRPTSAGQASPLFCHDSPLAPEWVQAAQADECQSSGEEATIHAEVVFPADQEASEVAQPREAALDGLLTNDKFCVTRRAVLPLSWSRQPLRLRSVSVVSLQSRDSVHAGGTDETHAHLEHPTPTGWAQRRADPMGSGVSASPAVEDRSRGSPPGSARPAAGGS
jgi:hypothetical protein